MASIARMRLDELLVERGLAASRSTARGLIMAGLVLVADRLSDKAGTLVPVNADVRLKQRPRFVSRGGDKMAHALDEFGLDVTGTSALDVGASTGGFVDCLLQAGATRVIALDVGRSQLDSRLRSDARVHVLDKVNARYLTRDALPYVPDFLTMDVSFISITKVLPAVVACMAEWFDGLVLVKPQFEAGPERVGKGGVIRDASVHREVLMDLGRFVIERLDASLGGVCSSGLRGADGNAEFFFRIGRGIAGPVELDTLELLIDKVLSEGEASTKGR